MSAESGAGRPKKLRIDRCDVLAVEAELKDLFVRNDRPEFPAHFERAYRPAARHGAGVWIMRDSSGAAVGSITLFRRRFRSGSTEYAAGLFGDLMLDPPLRSFFPGVRLIKRVVSDAKRDGDLDFLYSGAVPPAGTQFRAAGFKELGGLRRFVYPTFVAYRWLSGFRQRTARLDVEVRSTLTVDEFGTLGPWSRDNSVHAVRDVDEVQARAGGETIPELEWYVCRAPRGERSAVGVAAVALHRERNCATVVDVWWCSPFGVADVLRAVGRNARPRGFGKVALRALEETEFTAEALRAGFLARPDWVPAYALPIRAGGSLPSRGAWVLTHLDVSAW